MTAKPEWHTKFPRRGRAGLDLWATGYNAVLPPMPKEAREAVEMFGKSSLVLWEANWDEKEQYLDPAILVPVWRDLFSVVYTWDLTEVELRALRKASGQE